MPELWGVINVTPDSFSDGGRFLDAEAAIAHGRRLLEQGADVLDVGGESSRPAGKAYGEGCTTVSATEEIARVVPVVEQLAGELRARVSIDTVKPEVAEAASMESPPLSRRKTNAWALFNSGSMVAVETNSL